MEEVDEEEGEKGIESKRSRRQQSRWNVRGDQRVKDEEEGGALRKINSVLICSYLAVCQGFIFFAWREKNNLRLLEQVLNCCHLAKHS